jgi:predicted DNA-binding protein
MKRTNIHLTQSQLKKLSSLAKTSGLSVAEIVRRAIDKFFERKKEKRNDY